MTDSNRYLLDTNILSDLIRNPQGIVVERVANAGEDNICTSIIVASELRFGARRKGSSRLNEQLAAILAAIDIIPFESPADIYYSHLRYQLEKAGTPIGPNDMLIAAHALSLGVTVVTANTKEFSRVPELAVENWLV